MLNKLISPLSTAVLFVIIAVTGYFISEKMDKKEAMSPAAELFTTTLPDENGTPQALNQWQGKTIVLNFWATWCPPCREEMPELSALNTEYQDKNVIVIGIALDDVKLIKTFTEEHQISYPLLAAEDTGANLAFQLGNNKSALPYTVIIKPDGTIAQTYFGRISKALLEQALLQLLP